MGSKFFLVLTNFSGGVSGSEAIFFTFLDERVSSS